LNNLFPRYLLSNIVSVHCPIRQAT